jgi:hypothetical protein
MTSQLPLSTIARVLILVGGIILIIGALLQIADFGGLFDIRPNFDIRGLTVLTGGIIAIVIGLLALIGSKQVTSPAWDIILLILGLLVGSLGGTLVFIGSIIGLVAIYVKP